MTHYLWQNIDFKEEENVIGNWLDSLLNEDRLVCVMNYNAKKWKGLMACQA